MMQVNGDITCVIQGIVLHQVNCHGVMGAGLAMQIRKKWPIVYSDYLDAFNKGELELGQVIYSHINDGFTVASLCGQENYGRLKGHVFTDYTALRGCLKKVEEWRKILEARAYIPYKMGCGLAGGDWEYVKEIIKAELPSAIIMKYEGK